MSNEPIVIRMARPADAASIVGLFASSFAPAVVTAMLYGCPGASEFVRILVSLPLPLAERLYFVADVADQVVGCIELRRVTSGLFLSYIATAPEYRRQGLARRLLAKGIGASDADYGTTFSLDVFADNAAAERWYRDLGLTTQGESDWWRLPVEHATAGAEDAVVHDFPQAEAIHQRFGFSEFRVATEQGPVRVGRLGDQWFRLTDPGCLANSALHSVLRRLDPRREIVAILPTGALPASLQRAARLMVRSCRMECSLRIVARHLGLDAEG